MPKPSSPNGAGLAVMSLDVGAYSTRVAVAARFFSMIDPRVGETLSLIPYPRNEFLGYYPSTH
jgi:hypothetical protein